MATIVALYIDPRGPYPRMPDVECWDESRDARTYDGPHPVVSHPPCGAWSNLRHLSRGAGKECGPIAVEQVQRFGGVLEQPAGSKLWEACGLTIPKRGGEIAWHDACSFSLEVEQVAWGHVARKRTWLYCVCVDPTLVLNTIRTGGTPTHWVSGGGTGRGKTPPGIKVCSAQQRRRTPPVFADWLVMLARSVNG